MGWMEIYNIRRGKASRQDLFKIDRSQSCLLCRVTKKNSRNRVLANVERDESGNQAGISTSNAITTTISGFDS